MAVFLPFNIKGHASVMLSTFTVGYILYDLYVLLSSQFRNLLAYVLQLLHVATFLTNFLIL